jgi:metallo-beta-lactamase family protein
VDAVILTHAHLDHSGYLPLFVRNGFKGPIYCTDATLDLCSILLPDSGHIHEEDALRANRYGYTKHHPALPLYTEEDAFLALDQFKALRFSKDYHIDKKVFFRFEPVGHILGAAYLRLDDETSSITFSGDVGRQQDPIMYPPSPLHDTDYLVVESTYGDRLHEATDMYTALANVINETSAKGGSIVIPSFAVGRAQSILYHIYKLKQKQKIPDLPVYLDSPMSIRATEVLCKHHSLHKLNDDESKDVSGIAKHVTSIEESKRIDHSSYPSIIVSASGMASGGRVLHHLKVFLRDHRSTILFAGFQAAETRGRKMIEGAKTIKIHGEHIPVKARIASIPGASAHADYNELITWLKTLQSRPSKVFVTHGEEEASIALAKKLRAEFAWDVEVPDYLDEVNL